MKFIVEIDGATPDGCEIINYLKSSKAVGKSVHIRKLSGKAVLPLSPEEMALPFGRKPTPKELEAFLDRKQGKGSNIETVRKRLMESLTRTRKAA